jgi:hypothetical protein
LTVRSAQDFDAFYADRLFEPEVTDDLLLLSFDGKGARCGMRIYGRRPRLVPKLIRVETKGFFTR